MPRHDHLCANGHTFERLVAISELDLPQRCECGSLAHRVFLTAPMSFVQPDICYDSPVDGRPITSKQARIEDLARNNCQEYDPEMKTDYRRRLQASETALERAVDETVDRELAAMPSRKREKLEAELHGGMTIDPIRVTPNAKPLTVDIQHG
jgi:hypothetical protein